MIAQSSRTRDVGMLEPVNPAFHDIVGLESMVIISPSPVEELSGITAR